MIGHVRPAVAPSRCRLTAALLSHFSLSPFPPRRPPNRLLLLLPCIALLPKHVSPKRCCHAAESQSQSPQSTLHWEKGAHVICSCSLGRGHRDAPFQEFCYMHSNIQCTGFLQYISDSGGEQDNGGWMWRRSPRFALFSVLVFSHRQT